VERLGADSPQARERRRPRSLRQRGPHRGGRFGAAFGEALARAAGGPRRRPAPAGLSPPLPPRHLLQLHR
jgi:hypothetical protein